jgi:uncharacterized protein (TIGR03083 family)
MTAPAEGAEADHQADKDRLVELLGTEWAVIDGLMASLGDPTWSKPALPGWDVHDTLAHLIGTERMLTGAEQPEAPPGTGEAAHVRNPIAKVNEIWIASLKDRSPAELLADFRAVTTERLGALRSMSVEDFDAPSWTPVGDATYARFMQVRLFDFFMHEQDIRAAVGVGGNEDGPVAEMAVDEVAGALGYIIGKRGGAPDGSSVEISLTGPVHRRLCVVVDGRARVVDRLDGAPTAGLALTSSLFLRLAGGRVDPEASLGEMALTGDTALARQLATHLAYTI